MSGLLSQAEGKCDWSQESAAPMSENYSFAPLGLVCLPRSPRLAPWAAFLRRFAAKARLHCRGRNSSSQAHASGAEGRIYSWRFPARANSCPSRIWWLRCG